MEILNLLFTSIALLLLVLLFFYNLFYKKNVLKEKDLWGFDLPLGINVFLTLNILLSGITTTFIFVILFYQIIRTI